MLQCEHSLALLKEKLALIEPLVEALKNAKTIFEKISLFEEIPQVEEQLNNMPCLKKYILKANPIEELAIKAILAVGQGHIVFATLDSPQTRGKAFQKLIHSLSEVEAFYQFLGGITGYYATILNFLVEKKNCESPLKEIHFQRPVGFDISSDINKARRTVKWGIESLPIMAEIYPVGGAGDRLQLIDPHTGEDLPAALLSLGGLSLLEGLIRDLQAKEFVYWKLFDIQLVTPIGMMTSFEKNNDQRIRDKCKQCSFFGRPEESFRWFTQPQVPVLTENGDFSLSQPLELKLKPGGHGVIWKLAYENKIFDWLKSCKREKILLRQINNPIAGTDSTLLSFSGIGCHEKKIFGFVSCERLIKAAEGMVVLREEKIEKHYRYSVANIEYSDFHKWGLKDEPKEAKSPFSTYPANTNILFADIAAIEKLLFSIPVPGLLINMKNKVPFLDEQGVMTEVYGGRLESTMQNISDGIFNEYASKINGAEDQQLNSFVMYGERKKSISVTKKLYAGGNEIMETTEGCFYDQMLNARSLFTQVCRLELPILPPELEFVAKAPPFIIRYHPALGPLYEVIGQKIRGGKLHLGAELILEIAELDVENLNLSGSLKVIAKNILGDCQEDGLLKYSNMASKCEIKNVIVKNRGINHEDSENSYWKDEIIHHECLQIILHGNAEFAAEGVCLEGGMTIEVPKGHRMEVFAGKNGVEYRTRKIEHPTWCWHYSFASNDSILLKKQHLSGLCK